ncbi:MAG TPA: kelch repeat-containing protein [Candidatus Binatia bacterium]|nr:kelch repeat-containing protein [Candidatus Binatia bacterium]
MRLRRVALLLVAAVIPLCASSPAATAAVQASPGSGSASPGNGQAAYTWTEQHPTSSPLPRDSAAVAYDAATGNVMVSGGEASCSPGLPFVYTDTWTWDGTAWQQVASDAPAVFGVPFAYDDATKTVVLIWAPPCGSLTTSQWNGGTWSDNGGINSGNAWPDPDGAMAYDPATEALLLWSPTPGYQQSEPSTPPPGSSTWSWDGSEWSQLSPAIEPPDSLGWTRDVAMVDDPASGQLLLYGEHSQSMWAWNGTTWSEVPLPQAPSARVGASVVYDADLHEVLLFGGATVSGYVDQAKPYQAETYTLGAPLNDLWAWDGTTWSELHPVTTPPARFYSQMAYDAATGQVVLFGGSVNTVADVADTWVYGPTS